MAANELMFSLHKGDDCGGGVKMADYKKAGTVGPDKIADVAPTAGC